MSYYQLKHRTRHRVRLTFTIPVNDGVIQCINRAIKEESRSIQLSWLNHQGSLIMTGSIDEQNTALSAIDRLSIDELKEAYDTPVVAPINIFEMMKDEWLNYACYRLLVPAPIRLIRTLYQTVGRAKIAFQDLRAGKLTIDVLDASAIAIALARGQFSTAGMINFLLNFSDRLTYASQLKSQEELEASLALSIDKVWKIVGGEPTEVSINSIEIGDVVLVQTGNLIPFDGRIVNGGASVNESSMTGEAFPVMRQMGDDVFANTVVEQGEIQIEVTTNQQDSAIGRLVELISQSENNKAHTSRAFEERANKLVKYNYLGTAITYLLTRNIDRALSFMMVDYSCALRMIGPLTYLTAIRDAADQQIVIKGSKFIEVYKDIDTYVFDKTGTITTSRPSIAKVIVEEEAMARESIRVAACLEEHYHHPLARSFEEYAQKHNIRHEEMHGELEYIVSHGIASVVDGKRVVIGSKHFVVEDEQCDVSPYFAEQITEHEGFYNLIYLGFDGKLVAMFAIDNEIRPEAKPLISALHKAGKRVVLLTGDQPERTRILSRDYDFDEIKAGVLPEDKLNYILDEQAQGRKVLMIGDGVNDSAALSQADIGIVMQDASDLARQVSDIILLSDNLLDLLKLDQLSRSIHHRLQWNYRTIIGFNSALILGGALGLFSASLAGLCHNSATVALSLYCMRDFDLENPLSQEKPVAVSTLDTTKQFSTVGVLHV